MARWVKCKNRLPEFHEDVLMLFDNGNEMNMAVGFLRDMDEYITLWCAYTDCGWYTDCDDLPLYWMPLPKPPRGGARRCQSGLTHEESRAHKLMLIRHTMMALLKGLTEAST